MSLVMALSFCFISCTKNSGGDGPVQARPNLSCTALLKPPPPVGLSIHQMYKGCVADHTGGEQGPNVFFSYYTDSYNIDDRCCILVQSNKEKY